MTLSAKLKATKSNKILSDSRLQAGAVPHQRRQLLPKHQLVIEWLPRGLQNASEHAWARLFNTDSRQHVCIDSVQLKEYPQPRGCVP